VMEGVPRWAEAIGAVILFLFGGGYFGPIIARRFRAGQRSELVAELKHEFAPLADLNGLRVAVHGDITDLREQVEATRHMAQLAVGNADTALDKVREMEMRITNQWERITERMAETAKTLERVTERVEKLAIKQAVMEGRDGGRRAGDHA